MTVSEAVGDHEDRHRLSLSARPSIASSFHVHEELEGDEGLIMRDLMETGIPGPPDGGYGWVIVFASFVCNLVLDGITCTFGVFLPQMAVSFDTGKGNVAWAGSLLCGGSLLMGRHNLRK